MDRQPLPVLWLCGAPATGKSAAAWELYRSAGEGVGYVDIDQLKMLFPEPPDAGRLAVESLAAVARAHDAAGGRALIVSGVLDAGEAPAFVEGLTGLATLTFCLLDADDPTLRARLEPRGWPAELHEMVVGEAAALRSSDFAHCVIDTGSVGIEEVAARAADLLHPRDVVDPQPGAAPEGLADVVAITGPRAVGKSTIAWSWFMRLAGAGEPTGFLDADQLGFVSADPATRDDVLLRALSGVVDVFRSHGATRVLVNGNLSPTLVATLAGAGARIVVLDADEATLRERIAKRHDGDGDARLAGDDLAGADADTQASVLAAALASRQPDGALDVSDPDPEANVDRLVERLR